MSAPPKKLKKDAIAEAICELRFECEESGSIPESVVSRVTEFPAWKGFQKVRLSASDIPHSVRSQVPAFQHQPVLELREKSGERLVKVGTNVFSLHRLSPYPGWDSLKPEIDDAVAFLFGAFEEFKVKRLGLRYVNLFTEEDHGVKDFRDLDYQVSLSGNPLMHAQNLNYQHVRSDQHTVLVRVASPEFVAAPIVRKLNVLVDIDVSTPERWVAEEAKIAQQWIEAAHSFEKEAFFTLFTDDMMARLVEVE